MGVHENLTGAERAARYRAAKRAQGLRLKQIWVPDLRDPKVLASVRTDAASLAAQSHRWDAFWIEMEELQSDLWNSEPIPAFRLPDEDADQGAN